MIPASLIVVLTITFAVSTKRMAERHVIVRKLDSIEALGAVSDICSDKTGEYVIFSNKCSYSRSCQVRSRKDAWSPVSLGFQPSAPGLSATLSTHSTPPADAWTSARASRLPQIRAKTMAEADNLTHRVQR